MSNSITPPPELVQQWEDRIFDEQENVDVLLIEAYKAGADQELEACCLLLDNGKYAASYGCHDGTSLRAARRPKPPSLKELALAVLTQYMTGETILTKDSVDTIRRALEALDD